MFKDDTRLTTVRPISDLPILYGQFFEYRLEMLEERIRSTLKDVREQMKRGKGMNTKAMKSFLTAQEEHLLETNNQIILDELVVQGCIDDSHLFSEYCNEKD